MKWNVVRTLAVSLCLGFFVSATATASTNSVLVVPNVSRTLDDGGGSGLLNTQMREQIVYHASQFPVELIRITELRMRPSSAYGNAFTSTIPSLQINLSTTSAQPDQLNSVFAQNIGTNETLVFQGPLTVVSRFVGPASGPKEHDIIIPLTTPFIYDPSRGNLLIDFRNFAGSTASFVDIGQAAGDGSSRTYALSVNATTAEGADVGAEVFQLMYSLVGGIAPVITTQPESRITFVGGTVTLSAGVGGTPPLTYQWLKGGSTVSGATGSSLTFTNAQLSDNGTYSVVVSNAYGVATSQTATLTVNSGYDLSSDFSLSGNPNGAWSYGRQDTIGGVFTLLGTAKTNYGNVPMLVWAINSSSQPAILHNDTTESVISPEGEYPPETTWFGPGVQGQPGNYAVARLTVPAGGVGTYQLVTAVRPAFIASLQLDTDFHVTHNNVEVFGVQLNGTQTAGYTNTIVLAVGDTLDFAVGRGADDSYIWSQLIVAASLIRTGATNGLPPTIVSQPASLTVLEGDNASFTITASGSLPLRYQWRKDTTPVIGATSATLTLTNVQLGQAGNYSVVVSNAFGVATSQTATLTLTPAPDFDLSRSFSLANNPNGVWSYGRQETLGGSFTLLGLTQINVAQNGVPILVRLMSANSQPAILHNDTTQTATSSGGETYPPETTWFAPGVQGQPGNYVVARFTVPSGGDGTYRVETTARPVYLDTAQRDTDFHILRNNVEIFGASLTGAQTAGHTNEVALAAGETVDFVVGRGADNNYTLSQLRVVATIDRIATNDVGPTIVSQPRDQIALEGGTVTFAVVALGSSPLHYRWRTTGGMIAGATNSMLTITNIQLSDGGNYSVVVSNAVGVATSQTATLTVYSTPDHAAVVPRTAENTETLYGSGTLRDAAWRNQQVYGSIEFPQQAMVIEELRFRPDARLGSAFGTTVSNIQINLSTTQRNPGSLSSTFSQNVGADDTIVFQGSLTVSSQFVGPTNGPKFFDIIVPLSQPYVYDPAGGNLVIDIRNFSGSTASPVGGQTGPDSSSRVLGSVTAATGTVDVGADAIQIVFSPATDQSPRIVAQPRSAAVLQGSNVTFSVTAIGNAPLTYQWRFNGVPIAGATGSSLTMTNIQQTAAGLYSVRVVNNLGAVSSSDAVLSIVARAGLIIPAGLETREGVGASGGLTEQLRLQQVYGGSQFPAGYLHITELRFRPSTDFSTGAFTTAVDNVQINLSTTTKQPNSLSMIFAENTGANNIVVFSGPLSLSSQFSGPAGGPKDFDIRVPLQTPFSYNRAQGNLLIDIRNFSGGPLRYVIDSDNAVDQSSRIYATTATATQAVAADNGADVVQVVFSTTNTAPRLVSVFPTSPAGFAFTFEPTGLGNYVVEASTNLLHWTVLTNVAGANGLVEILDPQASLRAQRFYRARTP
jgi:hypothetical protein